MNRLLRDFRLLPLVLLATVALLLLKSFGLLFDGGYILAPSKDDRSAMSANGDIVGSIPTPAQPQPIAEDTPVVTAPVIRGAQRETGTAKRQSWAQEMFNYPDITGSVPAKKKDGEGDAKKAEAKKGPASPPPTKDGKAIAPNEQDKTLGMPNSRPISPAERAILERLQERRKDLEARSRELEMRETLLKATEKKLETQTKEAKKGAEGAKSAEAKKEEENSERFKGLVTMYENMKAKDAARIFDRLDLRVLAELAGHINPRRMSEILANMSPEAAERLTVEFASRGGAPKSPAPADLPKIEGRPNPSP